MRSVNAIKTKGQRGAQLLEIAIGLPVFLVLLMVLFWLGLVLNDESALRFAVENGVDAAVTRGNHVLMGFDPDSNAEPGQGVIPAVDEYLMGADFSEVRGLLTGGDLPNGYNSEDVYNRWIQRHYPGATLRDLPPETLYAMIYVYESMRRSSGRLLRYPCSPVYDPDPNGAGGEEPFGGGCLRCEVLPPGEMDLAVCPGESCGEEMLNAAGVPRDRFGLRCSFRTDAGILQPIGNFLGFRPSDSRVGVWEASHYRFRPLWVLQAGAEE